MLDSKSAPALQVSVSVISSISSAYIHKTSNKTDSASSQVKVPVKA